MRLLILILLLPFIAQGQIVRTHHYYKPLVQAQTCTYPLDTYTGANSAYSIRKLRSAYSGSAIRVRESGSNTEQDIGFIGCELDTASLKSFVGSNSGYVVTWYDQVNSNNATMSTSANQPRIVNAGVIDRLNGKPALYFDGSNDQLKNNSLQSTTRVDAYFVQSTSDNQYVQFYPSSTGLYLYVAQDGSSSTGITSGAGTPSLYINNTLFSGTTRNNIHDDMNGTKIITIQDMSTSTWGVEFNLYGYPTFEFAGYVPEMIFWKSDQSANRSGIISAINTYYSIY